MTMNSTNWLDDCNGVREAVLTLLEGLLASDDLLSDHIVWYDTLLPQQPLHGKQSVGAVFKLLHTALPDLQLKVEQVLSAEQHHILLYYTATGTHTGPLHSSLGLHGQLQPCTCHTENKERNISPTSNAVSWTGSVVLQMKPVTADADAASMQAVAGWHSWDPLFLYQQIGLQPSTGVPAAPEAAPASSAEQAKAASAAAMEHLQAAKAVQDCAAAGDRESRAAECKAVVRQYFDIYNSGDWGRLPAIVHPSYHYWGLIDLQGKQGVPGMEAMMRGWRDALSEFSISHDWMIAAEGGRVIFRWVLNGLHTKAPLRGIPATPPIPGGQPKRVYSCGVTALSITDSSDMQPGKVWRKVSHANGAELLRQLGVFDFHVTL